MSRLADLLEAQAEALLKRWVDRVRAEIAHGGESEPELRDHIPVFLKELQDALRRGQVPAHSPAAEEHGHQRYRIGFDVNMVVREYGVLRNIILDAVEENQLPVTMPEIRILTELIAKAIAEGVTEYNRHHMQEERKRAEAAHQAIHASLTREQAARAEAEIEREKLHSLFEQAPVAISILEGPEHTYTFANPAYRALVDGKDVVGKPLFVALPEIKGQGFDALFDQVMATGVPFYGNAQPATLMRGGKPEVCWFNFVFAPKRNANGQVDGVLQCAFEITEQVQAHQRTEGFRAKLAESEERLRQVVEASGTGLWDLDVVKNDITADTRMLELLNLPAGTRLTLPVALDAIDKEDRALVRATINEAVTGETGDRFMTELRCARRENEPVRWVEARGQVSFDAAGKPARLAGVAMDVTARKQAEAEREMLLAREAAARAEAQLERAKLHDLFMQLPVAIGILEGPQHVFTFANPAYLDLTNGRDVMGKPFFEAMPDTKSQEPAGMLDQVMATGETFFSKEVPIRVMHHAGGAWRIVNFVYMPKRNAAGQVDGVLMSGWDVTELVEARQRVEMLAERVWASEAQLRLVMDAIPLLIAFVKTDERYVIVNKAYEEWFGRPVEAIVGRPVKEIIGEAAYAVMQTYVRRGLAGEHFTVEHRGVRYPVGSARDVKITFVPHRDMTGTVDGYVSILEDITTPRRIAEERERLARQRTEVLESMGDAFFALDCEWRFILVNRKYEQLSKKRREETLGHNFWELFTDAQDPDSRYFQEYHRCMKEREAVQFIDYYPSLDLWTDVRAYPTGEGGISVFFRDVSAEKRAEATLKRQTEFEQQLIGIVSHDLRNPLNVILLSSKMLTQMEDLGNSTRFVVRIQNAAERATRLVRDLLDFTQARLGGGIAIEPRPSDMHKIVGAVVEEVEAAFPSRQVELMQEGNGQGDWDPDRLAQVVQNLVTNALKYSPPDTPVKVMTRGENGEVMLLVHNEGAPISPEKLPVLFEPFQRAVSQVDKVSRSVGLGLYIVRQVVEAHRGTVEVKSTEAAGTTFLVKLPRRVDSPHKLVGP